MDYSDTYGSYLNGLSIPAGKEFELDITSAGVQAFNSLGAATGQNKQRKLVLGFKQTTKLLVCNARNSRTIADAYGNNTDDLPGRKILVSRTQTNMGPGILVRVPAPQAAQVTGDPFTPAMHTPPVDPTTVGDFDDDVPF